MLQVWWPKGVRSKITFEELEAEFRERFPGGKINISTPLESCPECQIVEFLVPENQEGKLNRFLVSFRRRRGYVGRSMRNLVRSKPKSKDVIILPPDLDTVQ